MTASNGRLFRSAYWSDTLPPSILTYHLLATGFITGILDATTYADFGTFTSNQTGNTVLLGIGALRVDGTSVDMVDVGTSLASFLVTVLVAGQCVVRLPRTSGKTRWWAFASSLYQSITVLVVPVLTYGGAIAVTRPWSWLIILLLASSAGAQVAMAKQFGIPEIPTAMLTSPFADLATDPHLFGTTLTRPHNVPRNRRVGYIVLLILGVFVGAALHKSSGSRVVLLLAGLLKLVVTLSLLLVPKEVNQEPTVDKPARDKENKVGT